MDFSIVATLYHSASYIEEFYDRICKEVEKVSKDFEIVLVNDGSPDNSLEVALQLQQRDSRVKVIDLSRNFGHPIAMFTGLENSRGSNVFLIDVDLEEEPELFSKFYQTMKETGADLVYGVQGKRKGEFFERFTGGVFWTLFSMMCDFPVPKNQIVGRIMTSRYLKSLLRYREREVFLPGLWAMTGYKQEPVVIKKHSKGSTTYTFKKKMVEVVNAITSFTTVPLVLIFYIGALIVTISTCAALWLIVKRIFFHEYLAGWPSTMVSIWMLGGLTIFCIGLVGIYLSKVFMEAKQRPRVIIRKIYERQKLAGTKIEASLSS